MQLLTLYLPIGLSVWFSRAFVASDAVPQQISDNWLVDLRTVVSVLGVVLFGTWWIARWMRTIEIRMDKSDERFSRIEASMDRRDETLNRIMENLSGKDNCKSKHMH